MDKKLVRALLARLNPGDVVYIRKADGETVRAVFRNTARVSHTLLGLFDAGDRVEMVGTHRRMRQNILSITLQNGTVFGSVSETAAKLSPRPDVAERLYSVGVDIVNRFRNGESVKVWLAFADCTIHECEVLGASKLRGRRKQVELRLREGRKTFVVWTWRDSATIDAIEIVSNSAESEPAQAENLVESESAAEPEPVAEPVAESETTEPEPADEAESDSAATEDVPMPMAAE